MTSPRRTSLPTLPAQPGGEDAAAGAATGAPAPALVQTVWMRVLMESLRRAGVADLVVSPGSRSTPLVLAAEFTGLRCHTIVDERAAGFFALGRAKATGEPVALVCTSGTAGAHYYPAVIEAAQSFTPLIVLTADRPPELRGCAAPQTVDQAKLFGDRVRHFADLGLAEADKTRLRALRRKMVQAVSLARGPVPGPVHVNVPARKPLEPVRPASPADIAVVRRGDDVLGETTPRVVHGQARAPGEAIEALAAACAAAGQGVIVAGPAPAVAGARLARAAALLLRATGFPLLAEAASQLRFAGLPQCDGFDTLLAAPGFRAGTQPDLILQIGAPPTSKSWADLVAENPDCVQCVIAPWGWNDPHGSADIFIMADPADTLVRLADAIDALGARGGGSPAPADPWLARFTNGNEQVWRGVDQVLEGSGDGSGDGSGGGAMREGQAMRTVVDALPAGTLLSLGNSLPIRTVDTYCRAGERGLAVLSQRGANGIDGLISSAAGAASAAAQPVALVLGDVSFTHDIGGLAAARGRRAPMAIVVIDNQGGRIFEQLPVAAAAGALFESHWLTPPACDIRAAAALFGHGYERAEQPEALAAAVARALCPGAGCTIVHVPVEPRSAAEDRRSVIAAVEEQS